MRHPLKTTALTLMLAAGPAAAQSDPRFMPEGSRDVYLSLAAIWQQHPQGRDLDQINLVPLVSAQWSNGVFIDMNVIGIELSDQTGLRYGPLLSPTLAQSGALSDQGSAGRRHLALEAGGYLKWQVSRGLGVGATLMGGGGSDRHGVTLSLAASLWRQTAPHHRVGVELSTRLANRSALRDDFGGATYDPDGGVRDAALSLKWRWQVNRKLGLTTSIAQLRYLGAAAASPRIAHAGSTSVLAMFTYRY